ncbi:MAG: OadG family protein [Bacteroidales bacterium]|nr:OadG family protein [Bacteroidales bacterium]
MEQAFLLLLVGMISVFASLFIVVFVGNLIILFVNKYVPEEVKVVRKSEFVQQNSQSIPASKVAAISTAVSLITGGRGVVTKIEKV